MVMTCEGRIGKVVPGDDPTLPRAFDRSAARVVLDDGCDLFPKGMVLLTKEPVPEGSRVRLTVTVG